MCIDKEVCNSGGGECHGRDVGEKEENREISSGLGVVRGALLRRTPGDVCRVRGMNCIPYVSEPI